VDRVVVIDSMRARTVLCLGDGWDGGLIANDAAVGREFFGRRNERASSGRPLKRRSGSSTCTRRWSSAPVGAKSSSPFWASVLGLRAKLNRHFNRPNQSNFSMKVVLFPNY
jgi:hypothetical protein